VSDTFALPDWRELKIHPVAERVRRTSETEFAQLVESLERNGFQAEGAITLDDQDRIVDGWSRFEGCLNLDARGIAIEPLFRRWDGKGSLEEYVHSRNVARRHLTPAEQEAQIRQKLTEDPTRADRVIAREVGASPTTVGKKRREMEDAGQLSSVDSSVGADRKRRPRKPRAAKTDEKPSKVQPPTASTSMPIEGLDFSECTYSLLRKANIQTLSDLTQMAKDDLMSIRGFGRRSLREVQEKLTGLGRRLADPAAALPAKGAEHVEEPLLRTAPPTPETWSWLPVEGQAGATLWVPAWPTRGTDEERSEWAAGFIRSVRTRSGPEALAEITRQCLAGTSATTAFTVTSAVERPGNGSTAPGEGEPALLMKTS
jgi:hypothetical protein